MRAFGAKRNRIKDGLMHKLKLIAADADDLAVISAAVQDAIVNIGGIHFDKTARALTLRMSRYAHETQDKSMRVEAGLRIDGVLTVQSRGINRDNPDAFAIILNIEFERTDAISGHLNLLFAGGGVLRVTIEAIDVILADTDNTRVTQARPSHDI